MSSCSADVEVEQLHEPKASKQTQLSVSQATAVINLKGNKTYFHQI